MNTPLHEVVIKTLSSFGLFTYSSIDELFKDLIEPITDNVKLTNSLKYLKDNNLITAEDNNINVCSLTRLGLFASKIPIGSSLSRMIYYGIMLGVGEYSLVIATMLTISDRPFRKPSVDHNAPDDYNLLIRKIACACYEFGGHNSEPICFSNIYIAMIKMYCTKDFSVFLDKNGLDSRKFRNFLKTLDSIQRNTNEALISCNFNDKRLMVLSKLKHGPDRISGTDEEILKYLLLWSSDFSLIKCDKSSLPPKNILSNSRAFKYPRLTRAKIDQLFPAPAISELINIERSRIEVDIDSNNEKYDTKYFISFISQDRKCTDTLNAFWIFDYRNDQFVYGINAGYSQCENSLKLLKEKLTIEGRTFTDGEEVSGWKFIRFIRPTLHDRSIAMEYSILFNRTIEIFILKKPKICLRTSNFMMPSNMFSEPVVHLELGSYEKINFVNDSSNSIEASLLDVPFGMKLLNSYSCQQEYHTLHVSTLDTTSNENLVMPISTLTKGYTPVKWKLVTLESLLPSANSGVASSMTLDPPTIDVVSIDKDSLCYHAVPYKSLETDVYAVVSTLTHSKKENKRYCQCEYVTILPYDEEWLLNALSCVSDIKPKVDGEPLEESKVDDSNVVDDDDDWMTEVDDGSKVIVELADKIKTIIRTKSLSPDDTYLKSDDLRKRLVELHNKLSNNTLDAEIIKDSDNRHLNGIVPTGKSYIQSYIVSNLSLGNDTNKKMSDNILHTEFGNFGLVEELKFYNMLEIATVKIRHFTDNNGNAVLDGYPIHGTPMDLYGLYINGTPITVYNLNPVSVEISKHQRSLKLEQLPDLPSEMLNMLKGELKELFCKDEIYEVTMKHNGKAYVHFNNWSKAEIVQRGLALNGILVGQSKLMKVEIKKMY